MKPFNIALDGPSGVGKSTAADALAGHYNLIHLDTGAMYRAIGLGLDSLGIKPDDPDLEKALDTLSVAMDQDKIFLNNEDVSATIRLPEVSALASLYAVVPAVRKKLVAMQQQIAKDGGYILDGRDICDVVLPDAKVKIYLDASAKARAWRRTLQDQKKGIQVHYEEVLAQIEARDLQDSTRAVSPLKPSKDAVIIDTSNLDLEQTIAALIAETNRQLQKGTV